MKTETRVLDVDSTLTGEKVGMTIDEGALAHIMSVLTDLYSDPEMAVIREYSTNAFDAHIEAGVSRPIEVTTPTPLAPFFKVRDFGAGLDAADIRDIYSRYGASTKRETNDMVGMLGLGCKSALTYTDQFTITGVKDGICTQVSVSRDEDGSGSMTIVAEYETDDPSGVEILVPTKRHHYFEEKTETFFSFWPEGTVLVNGKQPKRVDGLWLNDNLLLSEDVEQDVVVMGNVAYPMIRTDDRWNRRANHTYAVVAFVNIGDVNFTPSREALQMNAKTKATLERVRTDVKTLREQAIQKNIDAAATPREALKVYLQASRMDYNPKQPNYRGTDIPLYFQIRETVSVPDTANGGFKNIEQDKQFVLVDGHKYYRAKGWDRRTKFSCNAFDSTFFFVGYEGGDFTPTKRKKLEQWQDEKGLSTPQHYALVSEVPATLTDWIDPTRIFNWDEVKAQKIVRANQTRNDGRPSGSYDGYVDGIHQSTIKAEDIDTTKPVYFTNRTQNGYRASEYERVLSATVKDYTHVVIASNRVAKFQRDFPMAVEAKNAVTDLAEQWKKNLTKDQITLLVVGGDYYRKGDLATLRQLDETLVDDPEVKAGILLAKTDLDKTLRSQYDKIFSYYNDLDSDWETPLNNYLILRAAGLSGKMNDKMKQEIYLYVNAAYAAGKDGN